MAYDKARLDAAIKYVDHRRETFHEAEIDAIAWTVTIHRIPYLIFVPAYIEAKGAIPEVFHRYITETLDFCPPKEEN